MALADRGLDPEQIEQLHAYVAGMSPEVRQLLVRFPLGALLKVDEEALCADHADLKYVVVVSYFEPDLNTCDGREGFVGGQPVYVDGLGGEDMTVEVAKHDRGAWPPMHLKLLHEGPEIGTGALGRTDFAEIKLAVEHAEAAEPEPIPIEPKVVITTKRDKPNLMRAFGLGDD